MSGASEAILKRLDGKRALVTGAAQGIGRATVEMFVREGPRCSRWPIPASAPAST